MNIIHTEIMPKLYTTIFVGSGTEGPNEPDTFTPNFRDDDAFDTFLKNIGGWVLEKSLYITLIALMGCVLGLAIYGRDPDKRKRWLIGLGICAVALAIFGSFAAFTDLVQSPLSDNFN